VDDNPVSDFKMKALRLQYWHTALETIPLGLAIIFFPKQVAKAMRLGEQDQTVFGICGAIWLAFGLLATRGIRDPLKWSPLLVLQFTYKVLWFTMVLGLMAVRGEFDLAKAKGFMLGFAPFVAADIIAVPWKHLLRGGGS
jgi:hypothetical protein